MTRPVPAAARPARWTTAAGGGLLALALGLTGCGTAATPEEPSRPGQAEGSNTYLEGVLATPSATSADPLAGDVRFVSTLLLNHYDIVQESDEILGREQIDDEVRRVAEAVRADADGRIQTLTDQLEAWGEEVPPAPQPLGESSSAPAPEATVDASEAEVSAKQQAARNMVAGLLTDADRNALVTAADGSAQTIYLMHMHRLYQGGVTLAGTERDEGTDEQTRALAEQLIEGHQSRMEEIVVLLNRRGAIGADPTRTAPPSGYTGPVVIESAVGADGSYVDYTPSALYDLWSSLPPAPSESASGSAEGSPSPTPTPADTARPTPTPGASASPSD